MIALRVVGGLFAAFLLISAMVRYRRRRITRLNLIISVGLGLVGGRTSRPAGVVL